MPMPRFAWIGTTRNAQPLLELRKVDVNAQHLGPVDQIDRQHDGHAQVHQLRRQVKMPFEVGGIDDGDNHVGPIFVLDVAEQKIDRDHLVRDCAARGCKCPASR